MVELNISSDLRKKGIEEEKVIIQAAGASKGGDNSLREMIAELVAQKFEEGKNDPDQSNAPYAYAKTRHMLDRHNYLLTLSESEKDLEEEMRRIYSLTTVNPVVLMSQYFAIPTTHDRFSWAGRLASMESTLMYDTMQVIAIHPGAMLEKYNEKIADPVRGKLLSGLQSLYNENKTEMRPNKPSNESRHQEAKSKSSTSGGCMLVVIVVAFLLCLVSFFVL